MLLATIHRTVTVAVDPEIETVAEPEGSVDVTVEAHVVQYVFELDVHVPELTE